MASLNVSTNELAIVGNNIVSHGEEFSTLLTEIKAENDRLLDAWKGSDAEKYASKIEEEAKIMNQLADAINSTGEFLIQIAKAYETARDEAAGAIK